jgi:hypothetical protein
VNVCDVVSGEVNVNRAVNKNVIKPIEEHQILFLEQDVSQRCLFAYYLMVMQ